MQRLIAAWLSLAMLFGYANANPAVKTTAGITTQLRQKVPGVVAPISYEDCGVINAAYLPEEHRIVVCNENTALSTAEQRFIILHETAHAIIDQKGIPYTGSEEVAADELAAVLLIENGHDQDVVDVALAWLGRSTPDIAGDAHVSSARRGVYLLCMAMQGAHGLTSDDCYGDYDHQRKSWLKMLNVQSLQ